MLSEDLELADRDRATVGFETVKDGDRVPVTVMLRVRLDVTLDVLHLETVLHLVILLLLVLDTVAVALKVARAWTLAEKPRTPTKRS